ncbi:MAG: MarR family transcriptional regulator [Candidatus Omnitrophica bacterium]|nr:MarR family transcriptional regulator [Candidatus Omnitrophota bacterium]
MAVFDPEIQNLIRVVQSRMTRFFGITLSKRKISLSQYHVLVALAQEGDLSMSQLAQRLQITKPAITNLVGKLEKEQLLVRKRDPKDRRMLPVGLTAKGEHTVKSIQKIFIDFIGRTFSRVSDADRFIIKRFYQILIEEMESYRLP